jgi:hypothetical protein
MLPLGAGVRRSNANMRDAMREKILGHCLLLIVLVVVVYECYEL